MFLLTFDTVNHDILLQKLEHYLTDRMQYVSVNGSDSETKRVKTTVVYSRDYSKFSADSFRGDVSSQNFNVEFVNINDQFNDFYYKLEGCVDRHAP